MFGYVYLVTVFSCYCICIYIIFCYLFGKIKLLLQVLLFCCIWPHDQYSDYCCLCCPKRVAQLACRSDEYRPNTGCSLLYSHEYSAYWARRKSAYASLVQCNQTQFLRRYALNAEHHIATFMLSIRPSVASSILLIQVGLGYCENNQTYN